MHTRAAATTTIKESEAHDLLIKQRLNRPVSPHLGIYQPQVTWYASILNRITGSILSAGFYVFGFGYLVAPMLGWDFSSHAMVATFAGLSPAVKIGLKSFVAFPFAFHSFNGIRHLIWDMGLNLGNKHVQRTGYYVFAISGLATIYLAGFA